MSKPTFDLYTLRFIRNDALIRYSTLNQSEPLRINLYLLGIIAFFSYASGSISEAVFDESIPDVQRVASFVGGAFCIFRFIRECNRRSKRLNTIEKELNAQSLLVKLPLGTFSDRLFSNTALTVGNVIKADSFKRKRILALCGTQDELKNALDVIRPLRNRFIQASTLLVLVPFEDQTLNFQALGISDKELQLSPFVALPEDIPQWQEYFSSLLNSNSENSDLTSSQSLAWFGLSFTGKSFGSGVGVIPRAIEILGQSLLPTTDPVDLLDQEISSINDENETTQTLIKLQNSFYEALTTTGDLSSLISVFNTNQNTIEVDEVLAQGGRLDDWETCLKIGARPEGMKSFNSDVLLLSDTVAYTTNLELLPGNDDSYASPSSSIASPTLLAMQRWKFVENEWKLDLHQTIPWSYEANSAGGTLICDYRGCTALVRQRQETWNFLGMIQ